MNDVIVDPDTRNMPLAELNMASRLKRLASSLRPGRLLYLAVAYGGAAVLQRVIGFAIFMWLAHSLPVADYAVFGLCYALQTGITALAGAGIVESVIGVAKDRGSFDLRARLFGAANRVFAGSIGPALAVVTLVYLLFLRETAVPAYALAFVAASGLLTAFFTLQATLVRLEENHGGSLALSFFSPLGGLLGGALAFLLARNVAAFFVGSTLGLLLAAISLAQQRVGYYRVQSSRADVIAILARIAPFIAVAVLAWLGGYGNTYLVKSLFTPTEVAKFTFVYTLSSVMQLVATSLNQVWSPRFYRRLHDEPQDKVERANIQFFTFQGLALGVAGAVMLVALPGALRLLGGNLVQYEGMTAELLILCCAYAVSVPWWHAQNYFYVGNRGKELMNVTLVGSVAGLLLWIASAWLLGVIGVYVGFLMQMLARTVAAMVVARRHWPVRVPVAGVALGLILMCAGAACAVLIYR